MFLRAIGLRRSSTTVFHVPSRVSPTHLLTNRTTMGHVLRLQEGGPFFSKCDPTRRLSSILTTDVHVVRRAGCQPAVRSRAVASNSSLLTNRRPPTRHKVRRQRRILRQVRRHTIRRNSYQANRACLTSACVIARYPFINSPIDRLTRLAPNVQPILYYSVATEPMRASRVTILPCVKSARQSTPRPIMQPA